MTSLIVAPIVGGVIGYITNALAIRMLFRPHHEKYVMGHRVPFTPGIIPKEKGRIAASVGEAISANLMNKEVMRRSLLSDEMLGKISTAIDKFIAKQKRNKETLRQFLSHYLSEEDISQLADKGSADLSELVYKRIAESEAGDKIAHVAVTSVMEKMKHFGSGIGDTLKEEGIGHGGGFGDKIGRFIERTFGKSGTNATSQFINALAQPVERNLAKHINEILHNNARDIVGDLVETETKSLLDKPMCSLLEGKDEDLARARDSLVALYEQLITEQLPRILAAVDISRIIEDRINEMEMAEAEKIIFDVMDKELKAIVWLGAALGFIMGFINCLF